jgi:hypothetical protein
MKLQTDPRGDDQLAALTFAPVMMEAFQTGLKEAAAVSRWLLATLAAVNGAAAISMLPLELPALAKFGGAAAFLIGVLAALGAGLWSLYSFRRVSIAAGAMLSYWLEVADDGARREALELTMKRDMEQAVGSRGTYIFVFVSVTAFIAGCALTGWGLANRDGGRAALAAQGERPAAAALLNPAD